MRVCVCVCVWVVENPVRVDLDLPHSSSLPPPPPPPHSLSLSPSPSLPLLLLPPSLFLSSSLLSLLSLPLHNPTEPKSRDHLGLMLGSHAVHRSNSWRAGRCMPHACVVHPLPCWEWRGYVRSGYLFGGSWESSIHE